MKKTFLTFLIFAFLNLTAFKPTFEKYSNISEQNKNYLNQRQFQQIIDQSHDYQKGVNELLKYGDLLSGVGKSFGTHGAEQPYTTTHRDKDIAYYIFIFVKNLPAGTLNDTRPKGRGF